MTRLKVNSPTILSVGYEPDAEVLQLEFEGSTVHDYYKVNPLIYMGLMYTDLKCAYFDDHIKDKYEYAVVTEHK